MPTFRHGKSAAIMFNAYDVSTYLNEASSQFTAETAETTTFGAAGGSKTYIAGLDDGTMTLSGMFDGAASASDAIFSGVAGGANNNNISVFPEGATAIGSRAILGQGKMTSYEVSVPVADVVSISTQHQLDGGKDAGVLLSFGAYTATASALASVDNAASSANGGVAILHIPANTMNNTTIVKVQHSTDNSIWADLVTFTTVATTVTTSERVLVAAGTTVNRYIKALITFAGTGSATVYTSFARR